MAILFFSDVLKKVGINPKDVNLIRHAYSDKGFKICADAGKIYEYTCHQRKDFNKGYKYWAVFISGKGTLAKLYVLYEVGTCHHMFFQSMLGNTQDIIPIQNCLQFVRTKK